MIMMPTFDVLKITLKLN